MVVSLKQGAVIEIVMKRLREAGATVRPVEFTSYLRVEGLDREAIQSVEGVSKVVETIKELR